MSDIDNRQQIKLLRTQMAKLEQSCKDREDKLIKLLFILEPFLNALPPEIHKQISGMMD